MLNIDPIVKIEVNVGTSIASAGVFDVGAIIGSTPVVGKVDSAHRFKEYNSLAEMASDGFQTTSDEYKAAAKYFGVDPAPKKVVMVFCFANPYAEAYDASANYAVGDQCLNNDKRWSCNTAITGGEAWNADHWDEVTTENETPAAAIVDAVNGGAEFYAVYYIPGASVTNADCVNNMLGVASAFETMNRGVLFYGVTGDVDTISGPGGVMATMKSNNTKRTIGLYCTSEVSDAAGLMGAAMGLSRVHEDDVFALCYKSVASATVNDITEADVSKVKAVNGNVYVQRTKTRSFVENGATAFGTRFDDTLYVDRMTYEIQVAIYELIADSAAKLPQADSTSALFLNAIHNVLEKYYTMGALATAPWRGSAIEGKIEPGEYVEHGHAEFADSFTLQSEADRLLHKAMPITVLLCLSGSVESIEITVDVQT